MSLFHPALEDREAKAGKRHTEVVGGSKMRTQVSWPSNGKGSGGVQWKRVCERRLVKEEVGIARGAAVQNYSR